MGVNIFEIIGDPGHKVKAKYVKKSLCSSNCTFPILGDHVPLGKLYTVYPETKEPFRLRCGGCGTWTPVQCVLADSPNGPAWLPLGIFELETEVTTETLY